MDVDPGLIEPGIATGEFDLGLLESDDDDEGTDTSVLMFDDDEDEGAVETADDILDDDDYSDSDADFDDDFADDFDDDLDVFEAEEEEEAEVAGGKSTIGLVAPSGQFVQAPEAPWGTGVTIGVIIGSLFSAVGAFAGFELVRTMWMWFQPGAEPSGFLQMIGDLFV